MVGTDESTGERVKLVWKEEPGRKKKNENTRRTSRKIKQSKSKQSNFISSQSTLVRADRRCVVVLLR